MFKISILGLDHWAEVIIDLAVKGKFQIFQSLILFPLMLYIDYKSINTDGNLKKMLSNS